ncbi:L,D-transpeptidase family protein [Desulfobaculum senezii]
MNRRISIITLATILCMVGTSWASGWNATLDSHPNLPQKFLAIDKTAQKFFVYTQHSPLRQVRNLPCTTGQRKGDKLRQGDLRTPEGIYFVERHLQGGLNYELYGDQAFTLNFPNPVDKLKGKTGYGIWIHGRGKPLTPRDTQGCVALSDSDLHTVQDEIAPGLPVAITTTMRVSEGMPTTPSEMDQTIDALVGKVRGWAHAWETKSDAFFAFYHPERFTRSQGKNFAAFKSRKERLFATYPWIRVMVDDIRVLPGPDYWVTYFRQYYRTPTVVTEGIKRLYWQYDEAGDLRIVGREWLRTPTTLNDAYLADSRKAVEPLVDAWRAAWEKGDLDAYRAFYDEDATQDGRAGLRAIVQHKKDVWSRSAPERVALEDVRYAIAADGIAVTFRQDYAATSGYSDYGRKTLVFAPFAGGWKIVREDWRHL